MEIYSSLVLNLNIYLCFWIKIYCSLFLNLNILFFCFWIGDFKFVPLVWILTWRKKELTKVKYSFIYYVHFIKDKIGIEIKVVHFIIIDNGMIETIEKYIYISSEKEVFWFFITKIFLYLIYLIHRIISWNKKYLQKIKRTAAEMASWCKCIIFK